MRICDIVQQQHYKYEIIFAVMAGIEIMDHGGRVPHFCSEMSPHIHICFSATRKLSLSVFSALFNTGRAAEQYPQS